MDPAKSSAAPTVPKLCPKLRRSATSGFDEQRLQACIACNEARRTSHAAKADAVREGCGKSAWLSRVAAGMAAYATDEAIASATRAREEGDEVNFSLRNGRLLNRPLAWLK